jgi:N-methylhydantoinase A
MSYRIAADIGGTFTDVACLTPEGVLVTGKTPSTPDDYARGVIEGLTAVATALGVAGDAFSEVLHASTVATNAILEGKGARTALITTRGFRDVLELRRIRVPRLYEPLYVKPPPLVPRRRRFEVTERMGPKGEVITPLDEAEVAALAAELAASDVEAVAICFLHAYANPAHEEAAARILRAALPGRFISVSCEVLPEIREYERTSTTVTNAYIGPPMARYLRSLQARLADQGVRGRLLMMQSSGGTIDVDRLIAKPALAVESGPAAGVVGAAALAGVAGFRDVITFDMGGTTAKASLIEDGRVTSTDEYEVGGGISLSSRLVKGGGYAIKLPVLDVSEVGAGGGSIVWIDPAGGLKVGPQSAGAAPGPVCYGQGGTQPTVTDANVVLGYLNPEALAGGAVAVDAEKARAVLADQVAVRLGCDVLEAAYGVHRLANAAMMRAVKAVSTYRGRDPRDFVLYAFGGNGGVHAAALARELQMTTVVAPPAAGVFSALGLLFAKLEANASAALLKPLSEVSPTELEAVFRRLEARVRHDLAEATPVLISWRVEARYAGQAFELPVEVAVGALDERALAAIARDFAGEHERIYGHSIPEAGVQLVTVRVVGASPPGTPTRVKLPASATRRPSVRPVYFGQPYGAMPTPVISRHELDAEPRQGPLVIEEVEGTTVVPPYASALRDGLDNIVITLQPEAAG